MAEKTELKINKAVEFLEKINSKQDEQQTRSLSQKMVDSLSSIEKSSDDTTQLLRGVELTASRKQKETVSIFRSMLNKFFPKDKDMNRSDDNDEKNYREKLLKNLTGLGDKLKGLKDKGIFGLLFSLLGGLLKGLFNGFKRLIFPMISSLFRYAVLPILKTIAKPFASLGKKAAGFLAKKGRRLNRRAAVTAGKLFRSVGRKGSAIAESAISKSGSLFKKAVPFMEESFALLTKNSSKFLRLVGGTAKGLAKAAGPVGVAIAALDAGVTAVHSIANAGKILGKSEDQMGVYDRFRVGAAGILSSLTFGYVTTEKIIETQDLISAGMWKGFRVLQKGFNKTLEFVTGGLVSADALKKAEDGVIQFGRTVFHFFDNMIEDALEFITGGDFWEDWRTGWEYMKNDFSGAVYDVFEYFGTSIKNAASELFNAVTNNPVGRWIKDMGNQVIEGWKYIYDYVIKDNPAFKFFKDLGTSIISSVKGMFDNIVKGLKDTAVGSYVAKLWAKSKGQAAEDLKNETAALNKKKTPAEIAQAGLQPAQIVRDDKFYGDIKAEKERSAEIQSNVSNAFKMNKNTAFNNLSGDDKRLAVLMNFLLEQFAPYMSQLNAEAGKEGGNLQNVALVNPMK